MTAVIVIAVVVLACLLGCLVRASLQPDTHPEPPPSETELLQARLDLHRVSRGVDASLAGYEARREAELTKQAIADALEDR